MYIKRIVTMVLILVFALNILTSCNTKREIYSNVQFTNVYNTQYIEMPVDNGYKNFGKSYVYEDKIYVIYSKSELIYDNYGIITDVIYNNLLYIYNFDGERLEIIDLNFDILESNKYYAFIPLNDGTLYIDTQTSFLIITKEGDYVKEILYSEVFDYIYPNYKTNVIIDDICKIYIDTDTNYIYCLGKIYDIESIGIVENMLFVLTTEGEPVNYIRIDNYRRDNENFIELTKAPDGQIVFKYFNTQSTYNYYLIDEDNNSLVEYELPKKPGFLDQLSPTQTLFGSDYSSEYDLYYYDTDYGLYGYRIDEDEPVMLINLLNSDLDSIDVLSVITPNLVLCRLGDTLFGSLNRMALLKRIPDDELVQKIPITIAVMNPSYDVQIIIKQFNRQSDKYRIFIEDYSKRSSLDNYFDNLNNIVNIFNFDITSGIVYDMVLLTNNMPINSYINKNMFVDLYEYFEADPDISSDNILGLIRSRYETNGRLCVLPVGYLIYTLLSKPSLAGEKESLTIDEIIEINKNLPLNTSLFAYEGRDGTFSSILQVSANDYIDYKKGICNFDSAEFIKMIEFVKTLPETAYTTQYRMPNMEIIEAVKNDYFYFFELTATDIFSFIQAKYYYGEEEYVIKGYPNNTGIGVIDRCYYFIDIVEKSRNKEGAWDFIKFWLSDEMQLYQQRFTLPVTNSALSIILDDYIYNKYLYITQNGIVQPDYEWKNSELNRFYVTEADAEKIIRFFNNLQVTPKHDNTVIDIIYEEVMPFFAGAVTAEQCAGYIQNRVTTYLNERK